MSVFDPGGAFTGAGLTESKGTCRCVGVPKSARTAPHIIGVPIITTWSKTPIAKVIGPIVVIAGSFVSGGMGFARLANVGVFRRVGGAGSHDQQDRRDSSDVGRETNGARHLVA